VPQTLTLTLILQVHAVNDVVSEVVVLDSGVLQLTAKWGLYSRFGESRR
jgi:hypothetical protein